MKIKPSVTFLVAAAAAAAAAAAVSLPPLFIASDRCLACHNGLTTPRGEDVSIGTDWRASMMANSARDPYWQASVRRETLANPAISPAIEHECSACHMPMARYQAKAEGGQGRIFAHLPAVPPAGAEAALAVDGVSCALCHQIGPEKLGRPESFTAGFVVDAAALPGNRRVYGPHDVDEGRKTAMRSSSSFIPEKGAHLSDSEMCASCHTLFTHAYDESGKVVGELAEQVPYLEWAHSAYRGRTGCRDCHMPEAGEPTAISSTLGQPRDGFSRHVFRGGNILMPKIFNLHRHELGVAAEPLELAAVAARTADHLQTSAARISVLEARREGGRLRADVAVANLAGHKLPSAYPSRRAWIHLTVRDGQGRVVFESGRLNPDGSIAGNDNDRDPGRFEPHYNEIKTADEVQIYEPILGAPGGGVTTMLLAAIGYLKDNRIPPSGFDKTTAPENIAVKGRAAQDDDFAAGGDRIRYLVAVGEAAGPLTVQAELWYQPVSYRWAGNIADRPSPEAARFASYFETMASSSAVALARAEANAD